MPRIIRKDENTFHLRRGIERGRLSFGIGWTLLSILVGFGFSNEFGATTLRLFRNDLASVDCLVTNTYYFGLTRRTRVLGDIVGAKLVRSETVGTTGECGRLVAFAVAAVMPDGRSMPIIEGRNYTNCVSGDETGMHDIVDRINRFIESDAPAKTVVYDQRPDLESDMLPFLGTALFLVFGISRIIRYARVRTLILRKGEELLWRERSLFNAFLGKTRRYPIRAIQDITIDTEIDNDGKRLYTLLVLLSAKRRISFGGSRQGDKVSDIARQLREFLGFSLETELVYREPPSGVLKEFADKKP